MRKTLLFILFAFGAFAGIGQQKVIDKVIAIVGKYPLLLSHSKLIV